MSELMPGLCGNCGKDWAVASCLSVWGQPHTHPRSHFDLTPEPCDLGLCRRCVKGVTANLRHQSASGGD